jgi:methionyl-tRNA formyltransferase
MKIVFMGTPQAAVPSLERVLADGHEVVAVYCQPDRPSGRGNKIVFSPVKECALANNIEVLQPTKVKTPEAAALFRSHGADVAVVVAYGRILPEAFLTAFKYGAINVHFSLLPKYRGAAPVNWAIVRGETESGVTTMKMDTGLDTGDILLQETTEIDAEETSIDLMSRLSIVGADLLSNTLSHIDQIVPVQQDHESASLAPIMKKEDGLIDWSLPAIEISRRVRGFQPFPGSFTRFRGSRFTIWKASPVAVDRKETETGVLLTASGEDLIVSAGNGTALSIHEAQVEGKRRMFIRDIINGLKPGIGERFGN